jgi:hypothetical protein
MPPSSNALVVSVRPGVAGPFCLPLSCAAAVATAIDKIIVQIASVLIFSPQFYLPR